VNWGRQRRRPLRGRGGEGAAQEAELGLTEEGGDRHCGGRWRLAAGEAYGFRSIGEFQNYLL
jgi:hypothetical protein